MKLSQRMGRIGESATLAVSRRTAELKAQGIEVISFGVGEPDFPSPRVAVEAAADAVAHGYTRYTKAAGLPELQEAIAESLAERYGAPWQAGDVLVTAGAKMGLFHLAMALLDDGDQVVLPAPYWVSFPEQIRFAGGEPVFVPTSGDDSFRIHAEPLIAAITDRTKAVLINSPSNPAGGVIGAGDLRRLAAACAERGVVLISDETYDRFVYDGEYASAASLAAEFPDTVALVGSLSKTYAMTGWRLGYVLASPPLFKALLAIQSHSTSNATTFAMKGAAAALRHAEPEVAAMIAEYHARRDLLIPRLNALPGVSCRPPAGAFYAFADVSGVYDDRVPDSVSFAKLLLEEARVAVVPGVAFGSDAHVRFSFACSRDTIDRGLERIAAVLGEAVSQ